MLKLIKGFFAEDIHTKIFQLNWLIYVVVMIITTVYIYGRMDFVRSYEKGHKYSTEQNK